VEARAAAEESSPDSADVYIYDEIGESFWGGGISPQSLTDQINGLEVSTLNVYVNSPGGAAWDGVTIMNALRRHPAQVVVTVDGIAASAASIIAMAGDKVVMNRGSELMIHDAWGFVQGNATDMTDTAAVLNRLSDSLADIYAAKAGGDRAQWRDAMQAETWYTAEEAVTAGLADEWVDATPSNAQASFDLGRYRFAGRAQAPTPRLSFEAPVPPSSTEPGPIDQKESVDMTDALTAGIRERLGVTDANASEEQLLAALDERLTQPANTITEAPAGTVLVDEGRLAELEAAAQAGVRALAQQDSDRRDRLVTEALSEGRISAATRDTWRAQLDANESVTTALLASLPKNTVPVAELGHSDQPEFTADEEFDRQLENSLKGV
jgi:ATP-dependent protease ClpP protease subunit